MVCSFKAIGIEARFFDVTKPEQIAALADENTKVHSAHEEHIRQLYSYFMRARAVRRPAHRSIVRARGFRTNTSQKTSKESRRMPCGVVELGGRLCESTHTISKEDGSMWGVVFAFASVWCPEPSPAETDDRGEKS